MSLTSYGVWFAARALSHLRRPPPHIRAVHAFAGGGRLWAWVHHLMRCAYGIERPRFISVPFQNKPLTAILQLQILF